MSNITPFLWFDKECEEAINYYLEMFKTSTLKEGQDSEVTSIQRYPDQVPDGPMKGMEGKVLTAVFKLAGQRFMALDGGPIFKFNESVSFYVECENQEQIDHFWKMSAVAESEQCGWLKDKYGLSWQISPKQLGEFMSDPDQAKVGRVTQAFLQMKKFDIAELQKAFDGE